MPSFTTVLGAALAGTLIGAPAVAETVTVKMLNSGPGGMMVFNPAIVRIKPGDSVAFVATDKGHNVESIKGMAPEGAPDVKSGMGKDETVAFATPGLYGFKCAPHYSMGMVALVVVGDASGNLEQAKAAPMSPGAKKRFEPLFAEVERK